MGVMRESMGPAEGRSWKRFTRAELLPRAEEQVRKLLAGELTEPGLMIADDGVWLHDRSENGLQRGLRVGFVGEPLADRALAWQLESERRH